MESSSQKIHAPLEDDGSARSPVLGVLLVSDKGMVIESRISFAVGCSIELGVHMPYQGRTKRWPSSRSSGRKSEFITSEGLVVSCAPQSSAGSEPVYVVTLLFPYLERQDRRKLRHLASHYRRLHSTSAGASTPDTLRDEDIRAPLLGLN